MQVRLAKSRDIEYLSSSLSSFFGKSNEYFGFAKYKTDLSLMQKIVTERINDGSSEYKYFVAEEGENILGFVNILLSKETPEILLLLGEAPEVEEELLKVAIVEFENIGVDSIYGEVGVWSDTHALLEKYNAEAVQVSYKLKVKNHGV